jgi:hypothetical protein
VPQLARLASGPFRDDCLATLSARFPLGGAGTGRWDRRFERSKPNAQRCGGRVADRIARWAVALSEQMSPSTVSADSQQLEPDLGKSFSQ